MSVGAPTIDRPSRSASRGFVSVVSFETRSDPKGQRDPGCLSVSSSTWPAMRPPNFSLTCLQRGTPTWPPLEVLPQVFEPGAPVLVSRPVASSSLSLASSAAGSSGSGRHRK